MKDIINFWNDPNRGHFETAKDFNEAAKRLGLKKIHPDYVILEKFFPKRWMKNETISIHLESEVYLKVSQICNTYGITDHADNLCFIMYKSRLEYENSSKDNQFYFEVFEIQQALNRIKERGYRESILIQKMIDVYNDPVIKVARQLIKNKKDIAYSQLERLSPFFSNSSIQPENLKKSKDGRPMKKEQTNAHTFKVWIVQRLFKVLKFVYKSSQIKELKTDKSKYKLIVALLMEFNIIENTLDDKQMEKHIKDVQNWIYQA